MCSNKICEIEIHTENRKISRSKRGRTVVSNPAFLCFRTTPLQVCGV